MGRYQQFPVCVFVFLWEDVVLEVLTVLCPAVADRCEWWKALDLLRLFILFVNQRGRERNASFLPFNRPIKSLSRCDQFQRILELMEALNILELPPDFIGEDELNQVSLVEIDPLDDELVVLLVKDPAIEH